MSIPKKTVVYKNRQMDRNVIEGNCNGTVGGAQYTAQRNTILQAE